MPASITTQTAAAEVGSEREMPTDTIARHTRIIEQLSVAMILRLLKQRRELYLRGCDYDRRTEAEITEAERELEEFDLEHPSLVVLRKWVDTNG